MYEFDKMPGGEFESVAQLRHQEWRCPRQCLPNVTASITANLWMPKVMEAWFVGLVLLCWAVAGSGAEGGTISSAVPPVCRGGAFMIGVVSPEKWHGIRGTPTQQVPVDVRLQAASQQCLNAVESDL